MQQTLRTLAIFSSFLASRLAFTHGIPEESKAAMITGNNADYVWLGAEHMLTGYDHLLFIFGVIFFLYKFKDIVKFITAFTIGHSITLLFATLMGITANYYLVDAVIALTVIYKGFDNLKGFQKIFKMEPPNLLMLVFVFGLIHGFGLSTRLQQLPLGDEGLIFRILSFNVGVELGQIAALTVMLLLLAGWRKTPLFKKFSKAANIGIILGGAYLFYMQMDAYYHQMQDQHHQHEEVHTEDSKQKDHSASDEPGDQHEHEKSDVHLEDEEQKEEKTHSHGGGHEHSH